MAKSEIVTAGHSAKIRNVAFRGFGDGTAEFLGDQIEAMTGYTKQQFNSKATKWIDVVLEDDRLGMRQVFVQALHGDKTYMREYRIRNRNGAIQWIREWSQIVCDDAGKVDFVTGIIMDITDQKHEEFLRLKYERRTGKYLIFSLAGQEYGISISKVKEIMELLPVTPVPHAPFYVKGVINLRGRVIPIVDLRLKFDIEQMDYAARTCIIVLESLNQANASLTGVIVDSVSDVLYIRGNDIEDNPAYIAGFNTGYILGMAKVDRSLKVILDVDKVLDSIQFNAIENVA